MVPALSNASSRPVTGIFQAIFFGLVPLVHVPRWGVAGATVKRLQILKMFVVQRIMQSSILWKCDFILPGNGRTPVTFTSSSR